MSSPPKASQYGQLVKETTPDESASPALCAEEELDALLRLIKKREEESENTGGSVKPDPIRQLREKVINELVPVFVELVEKYGKTGISMQMDASNLLEGGREIRFEFGINEHRAQLLGTATSDVIAFHETRHSPEVHGELVSGPMLRMRTLTAETFRNFICERLTLLLRAAIRRR